MAFDNDGLLGDHIHIFGDTPDLGKWGNSISSMVIVAGRWELFDEEKLQGAKVSWDPGAICTSKTTASRIIVSRRSGLSVREGGNGLCPVLGRRERAARASVPRAPRTGPVHPR